MTIVTDRKKNERNNSTQGHDTKIYKLPMDGIIFKK